MSLLGRAACLIVGFQALTTAAPGADTAIAAKSSSISPVMVAGTTGATALSATLARADVAAMRSAIRPSLLKGGFGEAHMNRHLTGHLRQSGDWRPLNPRLGPQGMDGLSIRYGPGGTPDGLLVAEAKYGTSRLGMTRDGIQMGPRWRSTRLGRMATEYQSIADLVRSGNMRISGPGGSVGKQRLEVPLTDGKKVGVFARIDSGKSWEFVGPRQLMADSGKQADAVGRYLRLAGDGKVNYQSSIHRIELKSGVLHVTVKDAARLGELADELRLAVRKEFSIPLRSGRFEQLRAMSRVEVAKLLRSRYPVMNGSDVDRFSREIVRSTRDFESLFANHPRALGGTIALNSVKFGGVMAVVDVGFQAIGDYLQAGRVDWNRVGTCGSMTFASSAVGSASGQTAIVVMTRNPIAYQFVQKTSSLLGLGSAGLATNTLGGAVGGGVATIFMAYGGYLAGLYDLETANQMAMAGGTGVAAGAALGAGAVALVAAFGTASTGTAISTLAGASASSATLAWFGGGSLAAGGLGMAGGTAVLATGVGAVVVLTSVAVYAVFQYSDEHQDLQRIRLSIDDLRIRNRFPIVRHGSP